MQVTQNHTSIGRVVLDAALALHQFFETMLSVPDASPHTLAQELARQYDLGFAERSHLNKVAERVDRARDVAQALEERFGIQVDDGSLQGRTIRDHEGFTDYVFGRGGKSTRRVFSHHIMFGVERERWRGRAESHSIGYVESMEAYGTNPLRWDVPDKIRENERVRLRPLVYKAKGRHLLRSDVGSPEERLLRLLFPKENAVGCEMTEDSLFLEIMQHEIRHVIDHIMNMENTLAGRTVEAQAHLYERGYTPMRGFERDLARIEKKQELLKSSSDEWRPYAEKVLERLDSTRGSLQKAAELCGAIRQRHGDRIGDPVLSYVFSLVKIEHLPVVLANMNRELAGQVVCHEEGGGC